MEPRSPIPSARAVRPLVAGLALALALASCGAPGEDQPETAAVIDGSTSTTSGSTTTSGPATTSSLPDPPASVPAQAAAAAPTGDVIGYRVDVVATHPHDPGAWTQGLEVVGDVLLESTGLVGASTIRLVEPTTGAVIGSADLDPELCGAGATVVGDEIWQLTWQNEMVVVRGLDDLIERDRLPYAGQGWGLCATDDRFIMSDGSDRLAFRDLETFDVIDSVSIVEAGPAGGPVAVDGINELECVGDLVWANLYQTTRLVAVDPERGLVVGEADLAELVPSGFEGRSDTVANGVAHDPATGRFWLTGKYWPVVYEVELVPTS